MLFLVWAIFRTIYHFHLQESDNWKVAVTEAENHIAYGGDHHRTVILSASGESVPSVVDWSYKIHDYLGGCP